MLHGIVCANVGVPQQFGLDKITNTGVDDDLPASMQQGLVLGVERERERGWERVGWGERERW
jgi:hypothetical protein